MNREQKEEAAILSKILITLSRNEFSEQMGKLSGYENALGKSDDKVLNKWLKKRIKSQEKVLYKLAVELIDLKILKQKK